MEKRRLVLQLHKDHYLLGKLKLQPDQFIIDLGSLGGGEHFTLHSSSTEIISTHSSTLKPRANWDDVRVETAKSLGFLNYENHGNYYNHEPVKFWDEGYYHMGRRRISVVDLKSPSSTMNRNDFTLTIEDKIFWLELLFRKGSVSANSEIPQFDTGFGTVEFVCSSN